MGRLIRQFSETHLKVEWIAIVGFIAGVALLAIGFAIGFLTYLSLH